LVRLTDAHTGKWTPRRAKNLALPLVLPLQNNDLLLAKEDGSHGGYQFAEPVDVSASIQNAKDGACECTGPGR
jgi:hypothetical protein